MRRPRTRSIALGAVFAMTALSLVGCASDPDENVYCTDANDVVVNNEFCDDRDGHGGFYYVHVSPHTYGHGSKIPSGASSRALFTDHAARTSIGAGKSGAIGKAGGVGGSAKGSGGS